MDLQTFIAESLRQLIAGIKTAQEGAAKAGAIVSPSNYFPSSNDAKFYTRPDECLGTPCAVHIVEIDVAVTATTSSETKGGAGIMVAAIGVGMSGKKDSTQQATSRIKFSVPVVFPEAPPPAGWKPPPPTTEHFRVTTRSPHLR